MTRAIPILFLAFSLVAHSATSGQRVRPRPLSAADVDAITQLVKLEETRQFDEAVLGRLIKAAHPEVLRRAVVAMGDEITSARMISR